MILGRFSRGTNRFSLFFCFLLCIKTGVSEVPGDRSNSPSPANGAPSHQLETAEKYGRLPLAFELNQGQTDPSVQFISREPGYSLFLRPSGAVLVLGHESRGLKSTSKKNAVVRVELIGADARPVAVPEGQLVTRTNYLIGNDPARWHTNVPNYGRVRFKEVYPGIDVSYYGTARQWSTTFWLRRGLIRGRSNSRSRAEAHELIRPQAILYSKQKRERCGC
jgi:hypothetical protein